MLSASAASVSFNEHIVSASEAAERAFQNSRITRELLWRAIQTPNVIEIDRTRISESIHRDCALSGMKSREIVWSNNLDDFALNLLNSRSSVFDYDGLKGTTIVGDHFTWSGSLRLWFKFMQEPLNYDWRRYELLYDAITSLLNSDCADTVHREAETSLALVVGKVQRGTFAPEQIERAERSISSIHTMGISYAYAVSLIDAAALAGIERQDNIIQEMMAPISAYELGLRFLLATTDRIFCVERSRH